VQKRLNKENISIFFFDFLLEMLATHHYFKHKKKSCLAFYAKSFKRAFFEHPHFLRFFLIILIVNLHYSGMSHV